MNDLKIIKLSDKMYVNLHAISHVEILNDTNSLDKHAILFLLRSQNGDRIYMNKTQTEVLMKALSGFEI